MVVQNTYNRKTQEFNRIDDLHENAIKLHKLNSTELERHLMRINVGTKRRIRNNHAQRLILWKLKNNI